MPVYYYRQYLIGLFHSANLSLHLHIPAMQGSDILHPP